MPLVEVKSSEELAQQIKDTRKLVVMFSAPWCGPCRAVKPTLESISNMPGSTTKFIMVNMESFIDPEDKYKRFVKALPTFFIYKDGLISDTFIGVKLDKIKEL